MEVDIEAEDEADNNRANVKTADKSCMVAVLGALAAMSEVALRSTTTTTASCPYSELVYCTCSKVLASDSVLFIAVCDVGLLFPSFAVSKAVARLHSSSAQIKLKKNERNERSELRLRRRPRVVIGVCGSVRPLQFFLLLPGIK